MIIQDVLMMSLRLAPPLPLLFLLMGSGVVVSQSGWGVYYRPNSICAVKGSTVTMGCSYEYPSGYTVRTAFWSRELVTDKEPPDLSIDPNYRNRIQYLRNTLGDCSLSLRDVREQDQGKYYFRFITSATNGKYQGKDGVDLSVTELQVEMSPDRAVEGGGFTLTCKTTCSLTVTSTFTWYKNGRRLSTVSSSNSLYLTSVTQQDAGSYSCAVQGQSYRSPDVRLDVGYPPTRVSVSISPSGEIVEGSLVTLTCSSNAKPPAETYNWYKINTFIHSGQYYTVYRIRSEDSGDYKCKAINQHGEKYSERATLNVLYPPKSVSVSISPSGEIVEGSLVTLTCHSDANPPAETYTWYKGTTYKRTGETYTIYGISSEDSGDYICEAGNKHGHQSSTAMSLKILYPPKRVSVSVSPSGEILEGSSVTLTCRSDAYPPVEYNWFKETVYKSSENTYTINKISSEDSGDYKCKAKNQYGERYSDQTTVNVLYPPKNVFVSISPSGEIAEGSSVTLTCSSDANPPVHDYTWYKVNESSPVGSGRSYNFTMSFSSSGWFYCVAQNKYGSPRAAAVSVTVNGGSNVVLCVVLGVVAGCGCLFAIIGILFMRRKRKGGSADVMSSHENTYSSVSAATNNPTPNPNLVNQDDVQYASIQHQNVPRRPESFPLQAAGSEAAEEVQYAIVQHRHDRVAEKNQEDEDQYANVRFNVTGAAYRSKKPV